MLRYLVFWILVMSYAVGAAEPPRAALAYQRRLTAEAHRLWGLDAPIPAFAAQIHQESGWREAARSPVGAVGLTQFMPGTSEWISKLYRAELGSNAPLNPCWAIRALVLYDKWLYVRVPATPVYCDKWWFVLRSYNGGLGHLQKEAKLTPVKSRQAVDMQCGKASRSVKHCRENLDYPKRILLIHQPRFRSWGPLIECATNEPGGPRPAP